MILSMTGFGKASALYQNKKLTVEVKSLNSKQLDLSTRMPQSYREMDMELRNLMSHKLLRGKVDVTVWVEYIQGETGTTLNVEALKQYKTQIEHLSQELSLPLPSDWYATLLRLPDALVADHNDELDSGEKEALRTVANEAVDALVSFRTQEGARLQQFFEEKIAAIQQLLDEVPQYEQCRIDKIKARIIDSLSKLEGVDYDSNRLEQELIFYIEKLDITEEKLRLQNHLNYFLDTLHTGEGQGKKLGFISQEMGREINTLGSKANQAELQKVVVRMKDQLEQIKEQVLNVL